MKKFKNKKILLFLLILLVVGFIFGISFIFFISDIDATIVKKEIEEYVTLINNNSYNYIVGFLNSLKINMIYLTIIWICGIVFIFKPILYSIIVYKGFTIGFLISSFVMIYKIKGLLYSFIFMFPHVFINILLILILSIISIKTGKKIKTIITNNEMVNIKDISKRYFLIYLIFILLFIGSSLLEVFLNTFLIKLVI